LNWQESNTFEVATLIAQFELESGVEISLARMFREMFRQSKIIK
jgi:hypothetical protein